MTRAAESKKVFHVGSIRYVGWWVVLISAIAFAVWMNQVRGKRVEYVSNTASWSVDPPVVDESSSTGLSEGRRRLIVAGHHTPSYQRLNETQQMFAQPAWRIREVDYDNAPHGRRTDSSNVYRWWLALLAWVDHSSSSRPAGLAVEHAALYADPLLQILLVAGAAVFCARTFSMGAGALVALALLGLFPLGAVFQPAAPDEHNLAWVFGFWTLLPILAAYIPATQKPAADDSTSVRKPAGGRDRRSAFALVSGIAGGLGLWNDFRSETPLLAAIGVGGVLLGLATRTSFPAGPTPAFPWRAWAAAGCITSLVGYLVEYAPSHLEFVVHANHPTLALAWLGLGEWLHQLTRGLARKRAEWPVRRIAVAGAATLALATFPLALRLDESVPFLADDSFASQLLNRTEIASAPSLTAWLARSGWDLTAWALLLPLLLVGTTTFLTVRRSTPMVSRAPLILAIGAIGASLFFASIELRWWSMLDIALVGMIAAATSVIAQLSPTARKCWHGLVIVILVPGFILLWPRAEERAGAPLNDRDVQAVVERDVAYWLARQHGQDSRVTVFAPPAVTEALTYYGGVRSVGTLDPENKNGFNAAVRIASASTFREAAVLLSGREINYLLVPSWDSSLDNLVRVGRGVPGSALPQDSLIASLHHWQLPPWTRPLPYHFPQSPGFESYSLLILKIVDEQDDALAASRLAEYLVELGKLDDAHRVRTQLKRYPSNLGALIARAQMDFASGDVPAFTAAIDEIKPQLARRTARTLPFDRRVNLAVILSQAKLPDLAREQLLSALSDITEPGLRELGASGLVRLLALMRFHHLKMTKPEHEALALDLLPPMLRARFNSATEGH